MTAPVRLGLYGLVLVAVFALAAVTANVVIDEDTVQNWVEETPDDHHGQEDDMNSAGHEDHGVGVLGLASAENGYRLTEVGAPADTGTEGELSLAVTGPEGRPVTAFELDHDQELHLVVVRADGRHFRHVHPERDAEGTWSIPWEWETAGSYRIFADFVPAESGQGMTLSTTVQVAGDYDPAPATEQVTESSVAGFDVAVEGDLVAGEASELTMTIFRDGEPVTALEPYLGAFGHLVAVRDGDLAYLHVHPHRDASGPDDTSGPEIVFDATAPTPGRYLLFLDFQVDGQVHTVPLVIDTTTNVGENEGSDTSDTSVAGGDEHDEEGDDHDH